MVSLLLSLYPKVWREKYGNEYRALIEDTGVTSATLFDVVKTAYLLQLELCAREISVLAATFLYTLSGVICIRFGLTENWVVWLPTSLPRAIGLILTLAPLVYALSIRLSIANEYKAHWRRSIVTFWLVVVPTTLLATLASAFICSCLLMSTGKFGIHGGASFVCGVLGMALASIGFIKLLELARNKYLSRFTVS